MKKKIKMSKFIDTLNLKVLYLGKNDVLMTDTSDILRPGLEQSSAIWNVRDDVYRQYGEKSSGRGL